MAYLYIATTQRATSITSATVCSFTDPNDRNLIIARGSHVEIFKITVDGLQVIRSIPFYGRITKIEAYHPGNQSKDILFILTAKLNFCVMMWDSQANQPIFRATGSLNDRTGKPVENGHLLFIDPDNRMLGVMVLEGQVKMLPIDGASFKETFELRIDLLKPVDMKFAYGCSKPTIAMIFEDDKNQRHMKSYTVESKDRDLVPTYWQYINLDPGACFIIPVPMPAGGVLIIGSTTVMYINQWTNFSQTANATDSTSVTSPRKNIQTAAIPFTQITAWGKIDANGTRYLLGDQLGNIFVVVLNIENSMVTMISASHLGMATVPETLNYLDNGIVYVGSSFGDSQLIRLHKSASANGSYIEVLESYTNIGPIVDMAVVSGERQGQNQIITCSGAGSNGTLRLIRSGIGISTQAFIELEGLRACWSLRAMDDHPYDKYLVQSYTSESRILVMEGEEMGEVEDFGSFCCEKQTFYCGNMQGNMFVQVTNTTVRLLSTNTFNLVFEYFPPHPIVLANGNMNRLAIGLNGGEVIILEIELSTKKLVVVGKTSFNNDIACLSLQTISLPSDDMVSSTVDLNVLVVGLWTENAARILTIPSSEKVLEIVLGQEFSQIRDAIMIELGGTTYIFLGLGDGTLVFHQVTMNSSGLPTLSPRRKLMLATRPITFTQFSHGGVPRVFACSDRPTVIFNSHEKLLFSIVNIHVSEVHDMCLFNAESFPESLAFVSEQGLTIGTIDAIQKIHIRSVSTNGQPRRIAYHNSLGLYAVIIERLGSFGYGEESRSFIVLYDELSMQMIYEMPLESLEVGLSIGTVSIPSTNQYPTKEYLIVGTAFSISNEMEPSSGRVLVLDIVTDKNQNKILSVLCFKEMKAAVYSLAPCANGRIAACVGSRVVVCNIVMPSSTSMDVDADPVVTVAEPTIQQECHLQGHVLALEVKASADGSYLLIGDIMRSMTLLRYLPGTNASAGRLVEISRDFSANMMRSVSILSTQTPLSSAPAESAEAETSTAIIPTPQHFLGADDSMNFFTTHYRVNATTIEEQSKLELFGEYHLGDHVNVIRNGSIGNQVGLEIDPDVGIIGESQVFGTVSGAIGTILQLSQESFKFYSSLERAVKSVIGMMGGLSHNDWRSFYNERRLSPHKNFIDGDIVESFIDMSRENQALIVRQLNDDLNTVATPPPTIGTSAATGGNTSAAAITAVLNMKEIALSVDEVVRRVEDIARMH